MADHCHLYYWIHTLCLSPVSFLFNLSRQFSWLGATDLILYQYFFGLNLVLFRCLSNYHKSKSSSIILLFLLFSMEVFEMAYPIQTMQYMLFLYLIFSVYTAKGTAVCMTTLVCNARMKQHWRMLGCRLSSPQISSSVNDKLCEKGADWGRGFFWCTSSIWHSFYIYPSPMVVTQKYIELLSRDRSGTIWCKMLFPNPVGVTNTVLSLVVIDFNGGCLSRF